MNHTFIPAMVYSSACNMSQHSKARAIIVLTSSGYTAFRVASHRPNADIFAFTPDKRLFRQISLLWGVQAFVSDEFIQTDDSIGYSKKILKKRKVCLMMINWLYTLVVNPIW